MRTATGTIFNPLIMAVSIERLEKLLPVASRELLEKIAEAGTLKEIPAGTEIIRTGQYLKVVPFVLRGLMKIFMRHEEQELLLYYIQPSESCIMSFSSALHNGPSKIFAITEEDSELLLLPNDKINEWILEYPDLNMFFYRQFEQRYALLLDTVDHLLFTTLDQRILDYLAEKSRVKNEKLLHLRHREIASDLGTAREVVSRIMKRLEKDKKIRQHPDGVVELL